LKSEFYHHFTRNFKISQDVNKESIKAAYANGVLTITLPKKEGAQDSPKTINIL
jgi:HSP20 family protein